MPDLDQIIVKVTADVAQFKTQMASADASLDKFGASAKGAAAAGAGVGASTTAGATQFERYAAALKSSYGVSDQLTRSQVSVIRNLEAQAAATQLSGAELAAYTALRKAGTTADTEAGQIISGLATAHFNLTHETEGATTQTGLFQSMMGTLFPSLNSNTAASKELTAAHGLLAAETGRGTEATQAFRESVHALDPIARQAGASIGALGGFSSAARGGIAALAVAAGGALVVSLAEAADKADVLGSRMDALFGTTAGAAATKEIEDLSSKTGVAADTIAAAYEKIRLAQQSAARAGGIRSGLDASGASLGLPAFAGGDPAATIQKVVDVLKQGGAAGKTLADGLNAVSEIMAKGLNLASFEKIRDISPQLGAAIAAAFGSHNVDAFEASLATTAKTALQVSQALGHIKDTGPGVETTTQAFDGLWTSVGKLWEKIGESSQVKGPVISFLDDLKAKLDAAAASANPLQTALTTLLAEEEKATAITPPFSVPNIFDSAGKIPTLFGQPAVPAFPDGGGLNRFLNPQDQSSDTAAAAGLDATAAAASKVATAADAAAPGMDAIANAAKDAGDQSNALATAAESLGSALLAAVASVSAAIGQAEAAASQGPGAGGGGSYGDQTGIQAPVADLGANAGGGIYQIGGAGAPDSTVLAGMVTPGETVAIIPPDRVTPALMAVLKNAIGTSPIDAAALASGGPVIQAMQAGVAAVSGGPIVLPPGTGSPAPAQAQGVAGGPIVLPPGTGSPAGNAVSGGLLDPHAPAMFGKYAGATLGGIKQGAPSPWRDLGGPTYGARPKDPNSGYGTGYMGKGGIYPGGGKGGGGGATVNNPFDVSGTDGGGNTGNYGYAPADPSGYAAGTAGLPDSAPFYDPGGMAYTWDPGAPTPDNFGNPYGMAGDFSPGGGFSDPSSYDGGGDTSSGGGDYSAPDAYDPSSDNSGDYYGAYAKGGSFKVPGPGGTDSKRATMDLTPGEHVNITPAGQAPADQRPITMIVNLTSQQANNPSSRRQLERMARNMLSL